MKEFRNLWLGEYALNGSAGSSDVAKPFRISRGNLSPVCPCASLEALAYSTGRSKSMASATAEHS